MKNITSILVSQIYQDQNLIVILRSTSIGKVQFEGHGVYKKYHRFKSTRQWIQIFYWWFEEWRRKINLIPKLFLFTYFWYL